MKRLIILLVLVAILALGYFFAESQGYLDSVTPERIYQTRDELLVAVQNNLLPASLAFVGIYFLTVALSIPGATLLTLTGGFLFGPALGAILVNLGASSGAIGIFLAARYFMGNQVQEKYGEKLQKFNREIEANGGSYLLTLRFIPIFPFFLINLLSGFTTVKPATFIWTTIVGILPGSFVYAYLGYAGTSLEAGESLLTPEIIAALVMLGIISLIPVVYKKVKAGAQK